MGAITRLSDLFGDPTHGCSSCGSTPDNPHEEFEIVGQQHRDFKKWRCRECGHKFQAVFCSECGRAYAARASFSWSQIDSSGPEVYYCECGREQLHVNQRH